MKIRNGFVSNSSSSSFVVMGWTVTAKEIDDEHVKLFSPIECGEGELYFRPSEDIIKYIKDHPEKHFGTFFHEIVGDESISIDKKELIKSIETCPDKNIEMMGISAAHWEPDLEEFKESMENEDYL